MKRTSQRAAFVITLVALALLVSSCGVRSAAENTIEGADGTDQSQEGTAQEGTENSTTVTPTPTSLEIPTIIAQGAGAGDEVATDQDQPADDETASEDDDTSSDGKGAAVTATPTPPPIPRVTPSTTATTPPATPTSAASGIAPAPTATRIPATATAVPPRPTPTPTRVSLPEVSCSITPSRVVDVRENLVFKAKSWPANASIDYVFDHGDGTLDPGPVSNAYYRQAGTYNVTLRWSHASGDGVEPCGQVNVATAEPECRIGLGPADGLGWWCGTVFCREGASNPAPVCPDVAPYGCYRGMDGRTYCIDRPGTTVVRCSISKGGPIEVNEIIQFRAFHDSGPTRSVQFEFDHGDGTLDPGDVSDAYYREAGRYAVKLRWQTSNDRGVVNCGTVNVVASTPVCLVGQGPADGTAWICDGKWCNPSSPFPGCPPYPIYGCHPTVQGPTICIDPAPQPVVSCSISKSTVSVGEVLTFTASQTGSQVPVDFAFNHGDGTIDRQRVSQAYYQASGTYAVSLTWSWTGGGSTIRCGTVTVNP